MRVLFKNVELCFPGHKHHGQITDVFLDYNKIGAIEPNLEAPARTRVLEGGVLAPGFVDIGTFSGEPGYEHRETIRTLSNAGARGGYTHLFIVPNLVPATDHLSAVRYLQAKSDLITIHPMGAVSKNLKGENLSEIYDMNSAGVNVFTDGLQPIHEVGLMKRALQYVKTFRGLVVNSPFEKSIEPEARIHENKGSTQMGMKGIPEISEILMLKRDIDLLEYTESRLLIHQISSKRSTEILQQKKKEIEGLFASVAVLNLVANAEMVQNFDTNYLVMPPLREESDRKALIRAIKQGIVDCIVSGHLPVEEDRKKIEFAIADYGASTLPIVFPLLFDRLKDEISVDQLVQSLSVNPRRILGLDPVLPEQEQEIDFVWIDLEAKTRYSQKDFPSKSKNSAFIDQTLQGKIKGVFHKEQYQLFQ